jgi:hypothetical protein
VTGAFRRRAPRMLVLVVLAGCASARTAPPPVSGTGWGYVAEPRSGAGARRVFYTPDRYTCEKSRSLEGNTADFTTPTACEPLTISRGEGYWVIPALYLPTGSYIGGSTREECDAMEQRQGRNLPVTPRGLCRPANVSPTGR